MAKALVMEISTQTIINAYLWQASLTMITCPCFIMKYSGIHMVWRLVQQVAPFEETVEMVGGGRRKKLGKFMKYLLPFESLMWSRHEVASSPLPHTVTCCCGVLYKHKETNKHELHPPKPWAKESISFVSSRCPSHTKVWSMSFRITLDWPSLLLFHRLIVLLFLYPAMNR